MAKDTSTSSFNRFSFNGHATNLANSGSNNSNNNGILSSYSYPGTRDRSPDLESAYSTSSSSSSNRTIKKSRTPSRTPSPPLLSDRPPPLFTIPFAPLLKRRLSSKKPCLLLGALTVGLLLPIWIFTTGVITLDSFNDAIRYLPGYHHFANNLLYLVMFLLLISFTVLATLPILPIFILGLPFHLLIFSIFNKLMSDWLWWCIGCYTVLFLAPVGSTVLARIKAAVAQHHDGSHREVLVRHKFNPTPSPNPSYVKYSPLHPNDDNNNSVVINNLNTKEGQDSDLIFDSYLPQSSSSSPRSGLSFINRRIEYGIHLFSKSNRTSTRWRLLLAIAFWFSYVIPVTLRNEARDFDSTQATPFFNIQHPEWLCPATADESTSGYQGEPRQSSFEAYWEEYLEFHREMVLPEAQGGVPESEKRFLIFQPSDDGLGNRLQALLSSVVMAMVTRRAIVLDWLAMPQCNANFTDLFQQPEGLAWDLNTTLPHHKDLPSYKSKPEIWYPYCRNCALRSPITPESTWSNLLCEADLGLNITTPIVQIFSTQWFLPVIQHNPHWKRELCHMFPGGGKNAFQVLAKKLLTPSKVVQAKIDSVMERIPKGVTLIGLQVRRTENNAVGQGIEDSFLSCAADVVQEEEEKLRSITHSRAANINRWQASPSNRILDGQEESHSLSIVQRGHYLGRDINPDLDSTDNSNSNNNDGGAQTGGGGSKKTTGRFAYYLATDYRPTRAHFQEALGDQLFVLDSTFQSIKSPVSSLVLSETNDEDDSLDISSTPESSLSDDETDSNTNSPLSSPASPSTPSSSSSQTEAVVRNSVQGVQTAVAEMFLLAQADRIISSPYSTFGYFAHGYANVQPNIVKRDGTCIKRRSTQPCFQYWFGFANGGAKCHIRSTIEMSEDYDCWL
ncbi:hypothetical protein BG015_008456 [Linnemannia schmuckeri]|uniref:Uncharacterized protein n=1 Tax=Linnemannia schmuckeri TaxID=64567 RepID=A0A9P5S0G3_9FUNG|nr:hypothetical protein BG015_008456 [Linnemannia schmuckeri]